MYGERVDLLVEERALLRWLQQYVWFRWLAIAAVLVGAPVFRFGLGIDIPLLPVLGIAALVALYNAIFVIWQRRHERRHRRSGGGTSWWHHLAFAQIIADLLALTATLHFVGGIETPFFMFYLFYVGFGSIILRRREAYVVAALAIGLFSLLAGAEFLGWLPHVHLEGFAPAGLYREGVYVAAVLASFAATLVLSTAAVTGLMGELRQQWKECARARERELQEINENLAELDRMRAFFLGLASHDLKTPLAVVANYLQAILDGFVGEVNEKQRRWMERANLRIAELIRLINDFLDVSQLDPERIRAEMEATSLKDAVDRSVEEMHPHAEEKGITLQVELPQELPTVHAAPRRLQQAITNLLDNAIRCSPRQGKVSLKVRRKDGEMQVDIADAGPSIPRLYLSEVFTDYFRVPRKEFVPGSGLGLSTARKIVEVHGGEIWVESPCFDDDRGSRFSFTLQTTPPGGRQNAEQSRG